MSAKAKQLARAVCLGAASCVALSLDSSTEVHAQSAPTALPPVTIDSPQQQAARRTQRARSTARTGAPRRANAGAGSQQARTAAVPNAPGRTVESAWGHIDGFVATRSGTGTKTDTPLIETPQAVSVVTQDQIQAQGAQSIAQAVRYTSGVRVEPTGADARTDAVYVRGFLADQYLDSMRLVNFAIFNYPIIEPYNLERVEVLHGPASIIYGQASPGGVVSMVSKRPTTEPYHEMFVSTGNYGRAQAGVDLSGPLDKNGEFLYRFTGSGYDVGSQVDHTGYQRVSIAPSLTWRPDNETTLTVLGTYQRDPKAGFYNQLPTSGIGTVFALSDGRRIPTSFYSGEPGFDKTDRTYGSIGYLFERRVGNNLTFRQNLRYMENQTDFAVVSPTGGVANIDPSNLTRQAFTTKEQINSFALDNQAEAKFSTGPLQHTTLFGIDYRNAVDTALNGQALTGVPSINAFNPAYGLPLPAIAFASNNKQRIDQLGLYAQDQIKFDRWVALLGVRHDQANNETSNLVTGATTATLSDHAVTKRGALLYKFDNGIAPYIQYTESFQPTTGTDFLNRPFQPTRGQQQEAGIKYQPDPNSLITIAAFNLTQQNVLTPDPDPTHLRGGARTNVQAGEVRSRGVEVEGKSEVNRNLTLLASYTYLDQVVTKSNNAVQLGRQLPGFAKHSAAGWADYTFHGGALDGFGLSGGVRYIGESAGSTSNFFPNSTVPFFIPSVTLFDAAMHYDFSGLGPQFKGYLFQVNATNIFDKTYVTLCQDPGCYYGLRRQVIATLRYRW
jgi:iron complex outermembrane receptor protein